MRCEEKDLTEHSARWKNKHRAP